MTFNKTLLLLVVDVEVRLVEDVPNNTLYFMAFRLEEFFHELYILSNLVIRLHYGFLSPFLGSPSYQFLPQAQFMQGKGTRRMYLQQQNLLQDSSNACVYFTSYLSMKLIMFLLLLETDHIEKKCV